MKSKEKVIVSACLLGEYCRYDGSTKKEDQLVAWLEKREVIPFCPEAPAFGTPRPRIKVVSSGGEFKLQREVDNEDVTDAVIQESQRVIKEHPDARWAVLKSRSPSCGCETTPIFDSEGKLVGEGDGLAAMTFKKVLIKIYDETNYKEYTC